VNGLNQTEPAAWNLYEISRNQGTWVTEVSVRAWDAKSRRMVAKNHFTLPS
jgi:hypothetical protein